ncbi:hypothetical protein [Clostridium peptidivorans]|uniref:hypothetical protein n=1 Tax=Clostridium peptidivorans TaxID=100174 RepID=UPI001A9A419D|nr:hypothetical protein [Clostridium peptidivorans]
MNNKERKPNKHLNKLRRWFYGIVSIIAASVIIALNTVASIGRTNMVYAVNEDISLEQSKSAIKNLENGAIEISSLEEKFSDKPKVKVPVNLKIEENDQKSVDAGHSPWKLDPAFVAQVFVSLKISPEGIEGDYPIKYEDLKVVKNTGEEAIVEVPGDKTPIRRVYLERLVRQDSTGIWTVIGYDPVCNK